MTELTEVNKKRAAYQAQLEEIADRYIVGEHVTDVEDSLAPEYGREEARSLANAAQSVAIKQLRAALFIDPPLDECHIRLTDEEGTEIVLYNGHISLTGKPSLRADDGSVAMGFEVNTLLEALAEHRKESSDE